MTKSRQNYDFDIGKVCLLLIFCIFTANKVFET